MVKTRCRALPSRVGKSSPATAGPLWCRSIFAQRGCAEAGSIPSIIIQSSYHPTDVVIDHGYTIDCEINRNNIMFPVRVTKFDASSSALSLFNYRQILRKGYGHLSIFESLTYLFRVWWTFAPVRQFFNRSLVPRR